VQTVIFAIINWNYLLLILSR